jgi:hypothetical protein
MTRYIYKISFPNKLPSKVYIGQTKNPKNRWIGHKYAAKCGADYHLYKAMRLYGDAKFEVIATCLKEEFHNQVEIDMITQYDSFNNGYNMTAGGDAGPSMIGENNPWYGKHPTEETKQRMIDAKTGKCGNQSNSSKVWKLYFQDGRIEIKDNLHQWCKQNGYHHGHISNVYHGKLKKHKDIIKIESIKD